jgi:N-acetylglucosamine-6-phosphate deacetylase
MTMDIIARHFETQQPVRLTVADGVIQAVADPREDVGPRDELPYVAPGVLDVQVNGYGGRWFSSEDLTVDDVREIVAALVGRGVARCLPTLITNSLPAIRHGMQTIAAACQADPLVAASVRGIHLEGPWISAEDGPRGAHPREHVKSASVEDLHLLHRASDGLLKLLTVAPEVPGCCELIRAAVALGIVVSLGHTAASAAKIHEAADAGATMSTHLGNGCSAMMNRHDNPIWPQLADDRLMAGLITDGHHLPDDLIRVLLRCKAPDLAFVTCDVSGFGGCPVGEHHYGGMAVEVLADGRIAVAGQRQYLAGSGATTLDCLPAVVRAAGMSLSEVWRLVTVNPENALQMPHVRLSAGSEATLNLWRCEPAAAGGNIVGAEMKLHPVETIVRGIRVAAE